jgi:hypothetical protein
MDILTKLSISTIPVKKKILKRKTIKKCYLSLNQIMELLQ